ncbi:hypothetical protein NQ318_016278 [Aromia moschata]|uniref:Uncharacterized protein n=1 Tax=Aromia moschata TaxID=1265417 RepID=A0AAV8Y041_9CUCU|nr:hypothetical protein NQ318_016278 [Aromia moschata]
MRRILAEVLHRATTVEFKYRLGHCLAVNGAQYYANQQPRESERRYGRGRAASCKKREPSLNPPTNIAELK